MSIAHPRSRDLPYHYPLFHNTSIDIQFEVDQVLVRFTYPETIRLSQLSTLLQSASAQALYPVINTMDETLTGPEEVWSDASLIASCEAPTQDLNQTLLTLQSAQNGRGDDA